MAQMTFICTLQQLPCIFIDCNMCIVIQGVTLSLVLPQCSPTCLASQTYTSMTCHQLKQVRQRQSLFCIKFGVMFEAIVILSIVL